MKFYLNVLTFALLIAVSHAGITNRRSEPECEDKYKTIRGHTACLPKSSSATTRELTSQDKKMIVEEHNKYRTMVVPKAANMMKLYWDDELAMLAKKWAEACEVRARAGRHRYNLNHDTILHRIIPGRMTPGQNIARFSNYNDSIAAWFNERVRYTYGNPVYWQVLVGHYTQMVWAKADFVGCAAAICANDGDVFVCNYGRAQNGGFRIPYARARSLRGCDDCPDHCSEEGLCDCGGLHCNGGRVNLKTCTCECVQGRFPAKFQTGPNCELDCNIENGDYGWCSWGFFTCSSPQMVNQCPHYCNICPRASARTLATFARRRMGVIP